MSMNNKKQLKFVKGEMYEFEIYPLVDKFDPILTTRPDPFIFEGEQRTPIIAKYLAVSLLETMKEKYGIGLAANQCGIPYRVFVMGGEGVGYAFFNPEIVAVSGISNFDEGCLSFPGLFLNIKRPENVRIKYQDFNGVWQEKDFSGLSARVVLHEFDHMEGILFTSKISPILLDRAKTKVAKNIKILARQREREEKDILIRKAMENLALEGNKKLTADQVLTSNV
jgi:peptide deformylase